MTTGRLKVGDIVKLKSGGPEMTVVAVGSWGLVTCQWFEVSTLHTEKLVYETLRWVR